MNSLVAVLFLSFAVSSYGAMQNITVVGQTICDKRTLGFTKVELRERDTLDPDDTLKEVTTGRDGKFNLFGKEDEITAITPYLRITHDCDVPQQKGKKCQRVTIIEIPKDKIGKIYNMNFVNMNLKGHSDKVECKKIK